MVFVKGHPGYKKKGTKNKETILKEERRAIFDKEVSQMFVEKIKQARPEYLLDQFMGAATQKVEHSGEIKDSMTAELIALAKEELKKRMKKSE